MSKKDLVVASAKTLDDAARAAWNYFRKGGQSATARVAARLSYDSLSPRKIADLVKNNKLTAAFVLYEMGDAGREYLQTLSEDPEVANVLELIEEGDFSESEVGDLADDVPEPDAMRTISDGVAVVGSHDRLLALRAALNASEKDHINYSRVRSLGRSLR